MMQSSASLADSLIFTICRKLRGAAVTSLRAKIQSLRSGKSPSDNAIGTAGSVSQHVKSGRLRALAVTSAEPSALAPGLPTVSASGLPGYEAVQMVSICVPVNTPILAVTRLNQEITKVLKRSDIRQKLIDFGVEVSAGSPEDLEAAIKADMTKWEKVIKQANIHLE